jgi:hypothetical protein
MVLYIYSPKRRKEAAVNIMIDSSWMFMCAKGRLSISGGGEASNPTLLSFFISPHTNYFSRLTEVGRVAVMKKNCLMRPVWHTEIKL